ncbi:MAG: hypothetical protein AAGA55_08385, partial [Planctomycetota bacterium]
LPVEGGSTSLRLLPGSIGVFPGADYMVDAWIRTEGFEHARACLTARLLDESGEPVPGSGAISAKVRSEGEWTRVSAIVPGLDDRAAYLQVELLALQPEQQQTEFGADARRERPFHIWREDYAGSAWFDNVAVTLLPRIELDSGQPGQVFRADQAPSVNVLVRDLTGELLSGTLRVMDWDGNEVDVQPMRASSGKLSDTLYPRLPGPGWYRAVLDVISDGRVVGRGEVDLAWGASEEDARHRHDTQASAPGPGTFGLSADAWSAPAARALPHIADWSGAGRVAVGVWHVGQRLETVHPGVNEAFEAVRGLIDLGIETTIRLGEAPGDLADAAGRDPWDITGAMGGDQEVWMPWAEQALDRFGQAVISWQIGDRPSFQDPATLEAHTRAADDVISRWVPGPELRVTGSMSDAIDPNSVRPGRGLVLRDDGGGSDDAPGQRVRAWASMQQGAGDRSARAGASLTIEFLPTPGGRATRAQAGRVARRAIETWFAAHVSGVAERVTVSLRDPWRATAGRRPEMMPVPELTVWRTLSGVLDRATDVRAVELIPGVRTILAESRASPNGGGVLIAWLEDPDAPSRSLNIPLASDTVTRVELSGVRADIEPVPGHRSDVVNHPVQLDREPVIITGVDARYIEMLASIRLSPERLEPRIGQRRHELVIENPFDAAVQGKAFIVEPGGYSEGIEARDRSWEITPRVIPFTVRGGASERLPVDLAFGASQVSGWLGSLIDVEFAGGSSMPSARLIRWLRVDSPELDLDIAAARRGNDVVVSVFVTNRGEGMRSVDLTAFLPGEARRRSSIAGVLPGATAERRYVFRYAPINAMVSVALSDESTETRLLERVLVP